MELIIIGLLAWGGYEWANDDEVEFKASSLSTEDSGLEVTTKPSFQRGKYLNTNKGYYISNLSPEPKSIDGCDSPILTADLSVSGELDVTPVHVACEG